jgi:hypothetical protein
LHVDAAYGGALLMTRPYAGRLADEKRFGPIRVHAVCLDVEERDGCIKLTLCNPEITEADVGGLLEMIVACGREL